MAGKKAKGHKAAMACYDDIWMVCRTCKSAADKFVHEFRKAMANKKECCSSKEPEVMNIPGDGTRDEVDDELASEFSDELLRYMAFHGRRHPMSNFFDDMGRFRYEHAGNIFKTVEHAW